MDKARGPKKRTFLISSGNVSQPTVSKDACSFHKGREDESGDEAATCTTWKVGVEALLV